jgi:yecA family protein
MQNAKIDAKILREFILDTTSQLFESVSVILERNNILTSAAEIQGMICGMLGGGMPLECQDWLEPLADFVNQSEPLGKEVTDVLLSLFDTTCQQLVASDFALVLCLPDDAAPINERGQALLSWVHGFMLGFGLHQADLTGCSDDVKEGLDDFAEIARMDDEMSEDEESEQALFEVMEYVRVTVMLCFNELGKSPEQQQGEPKTVH